MVSWIDSRNKHELDLVVHNSSLSYIWQIFQTYKRPFWWILLAEHYVICIGIDEISLIVQNEISESSLDKVSPVNKRSHFLWKSIAFAIGLSKVVEWKIASITVCDRGAIRKTPRVVQRVRIRTVNGNVNRNNRAGVQWERQRTRHLETSELRLHFNRATAAPIYKIGHIVKRTTDGDTRKPPISLSMLLLRNAE